MANDTENRGNMPSNKESQSGSGSQQINRGTQSGTSNTGAGNQSSTEQSGSGTQASKTDRPEDKVRNQAGGPGTGSSQYTNAGSTGTSSGQISPHNPASGQPSSGRTPGGSGSGSGQE